MNLLRNRVRMLQLEHQRATKKINETTTKANQLEKLKKENDERYMKQLLDQKRKSMNDKRNTSGINFSEIRQQM